MICDYLARPEALRGNKELDAPQPVLYFSKMESPIGVVYLASTDEGLVYCGSPLEASEKFNQWLAKYLPDHECQVKDNDHLIRAKEQLAAYFAGKSRTLDVPMKLIGTPFQVSVWEALVTIPFGEARTYGQIAKQVGCPKGPRAVGGANNKNPISFFVP